MNVVGTVTSKKALQTLKKTTYAVQKKLFSFWSVPKHIIVFAHFLACCFLPLILVTMDAFLC